MSDGNCFPKVCYMHMLQYFFTCRSLTPNPKLNEIVAAVRNLQGAVQDDTGIPTGQNKIMHYFKQYTLWPRYHKVWKNELCDCTVSLQREWKVKQFLITEFLHYCMYNQYLFIPLLHAYLKSSNLLVWHSFSACTTVLFQIYISNEWFFVPGNPY